VSRVDFACPCERARQVSIGGEGAGDLAPRAPCPVEGCERELDLRLERLTSQGGLTGCLACGHPELYTRKDFPPALGIGIVVVAALLVPFVPYYLSLVAAALLDAGLYRFAPNVLVCYACGARHRRFAAEPRHPGFDRTIEERLRYGEGAVMGSPMRPGGTANAPDPEH